MLRCGRVASASMRVDLYMQVFVACCSWPGGGGDQIPGDMPHRWHLAIDQVFLASSICHVPSSSSFTLGAGLFTLATCG
jgi:hypothetical protein